MTITHLRADALASIRPAARAPAGGGAVQADAGFAALLHASGREPLPPADATVSVPSGDGPAECGDALAMPLVDPMDSAPAPPGPNARAIAARMTGAAIAGDASEPVKYSAAPERVVQTAPIEAQSAAIARAMASICNEERGRLGRTSGCGGMLHRLSGAAPRAAIPTSDARGEPLPAHASTRSATAHRHEAGSVERRGARQRGAGSIADDRGSATRPPASAAVQAAGDGGHTRSEAGTPAAADTAAQTPAPPPAPTFAASALAAAQAMPPGAAGTTPPAPDRQAQPAAAARASAEPGPAATAARDRAPRRAAGPDDAGAAVAGIATAIPPPLVPPAAVPDPVAASGRSRSGHDVRPAGQATAADSAHAPRPVAVPRADAGSDAGEATPLAPPVAADPPPATAEARTTAGTSATQTAPAPRPEPGPTLAPLAAPIDPGPATVTIAAPAAAPAHPQPPPVREAHIAAALGDAGFAPAIGATLAVMARDGVQHARLHLHPAELGPITVQIAVDGPTARIDFHAAVSETRQALEDALPALAGALRETGLTLTGGGVHQQAPDRHGRDPDRAAPPSAGRDHPRPDDTAAAPPRVRARRGLVDLVA